MNRHKFVEAEIPDGLDIKKWDFYKEILDADLVIDVPIAKDHGTTRLSLGAKNMLGVITNPGGIHANIHQRIADLTSLVRPKLTVVDAIRTLMSNGPTGGNLDDVRMTNTIIASHDIVAVGFLRDDPVWHAATGYWFYPGLRRNGTGNNGFKRDSD